MGKAQQRQTVQANKKRRVPDFKVNEEDPNDKVFIIKRNWSTDRPSDKLDFPMTRNSYEIEKMEGHSYKLKLPASWRGSRVFHADRLRKDPANPLPGQESENPGSNELDGKEEWEVDRILTSRKYYGRL